MLEIIARSVTQAGGVPIAADVRVFPARPSPVTVERQRVGLFSRLATATHAAWSGARSGARRAWIDAACDAPAH
jgi:hypothetical protein